jgi:hypothetical protein
MANTIPAALIPVLYDAVDVVSRELVGLIPCVTLDASMARAAVGQTVTSFVTPAATAFNIAPGITAPNDGDQTIANITMQITKSMYVPVRWNGEESKSLSAGFGRRQIMVQQFAQAMRTLCNLVEADGAALFAHSSRAAGVAATTPFLTDVSGSAKVRKILDDNGAPAGDRSLVIDTTAGQALRSLSNLTKANEAGTTDILRQGTLIDMHGFAVRESAQINTPAAGTMASGTTNAAGYAVGSTLLTLATAGTGKAVAGDVITFAGDLNQYVVEAVTQAGANPAAGDTIQIGEPGLRVAMSAAAKAITTVAQATRSMAFARSAILLATRMPANPDEGDMATDVVEVQDPRSGLTFEIRLYKQYRQIRYEVCLAWGWKVAAPRHTALLLG